MKKLTISDIAELAGVSKSTVSKVMNNYKNIPEHTRERILKIVEENNYYPFHSAQMLGRKKNSSIAFISSRISARFSSEVLRAIEDHARVMDKYLHEIIPYSTFYDKKIETDLLEKILYGRQAAAVVALALNPEPEIPEAYKKAGVPLILIENKMKNAHSVNIDNQEGGFIAGEYLLSRGHKNIGIICGWPIKKTKDAYSYATAERKIGFEAALSHHGIKFDEKKMWFTKHYTMRDGVEIFEDIMEHSPGLDAIFCASGDMTAMGILEGARKHGVRIPEDIAVMGYDDSAYSAFLAPPLTTILQPMEKLGAEVMKVADGAIRGKLDGFKHIEVEPQLVIRQSA